MTRSVLAWHYVAMTLALAGCSASSGAGIGTVGAGGAAKETVGTGGGGTGGASLVVDAGPDATVTPEEPCNGVDDDADGDVDEGCVCTANSAQKCFVGKLENAGKGICNWGKQTCVTEGSPSEFAVGHWGPCSGSTAPSIEVCDNGVGNGKDDDCDGITDNGCSTCVPEDEVCGNGKDDDCDGITDNGCSSCIPTTSCQAQSVTCGTLPDDGCGNTLHCGDCTGNQACTSSNACVFAGLASCDGCPPGWIEIASSCAAGCTSGTESFCLLPGYDGQMVCGNSCPAGYHDWGGGPSNWSCTCNGPAMLCLKS